MPETQNRKMRAVRFHDHGEPGDVLRLEEVAVPNSAPGHVRVRVEACGLTPADWALCRGLFTGDLPRGIGLEVAGTVDALGEGVAGIAVGDRVLGVPDFANYPSAGAAEFAIISHWAAIPPGLDAHKAAAMPMAVETAYRALEALGVTDKQTVLINGAGGTVGFAAVQIALMRGCRVIATTGKSFDDRLRALGAETTPYGDGVADRVRNLAKGPVDLVLDTAPVHGALPELVTITGDPQRVLTISDFEGAEKLGVRTTGRDPDHKDRYDVLGEFAQLAAAGKFEIPIAGTYSLDDWHSALDVSLSGHANGKLLLLPDAAT